MNFFFSVLVASILPFAAFASELEIRPIVDAPTSTSKEFALKFHKRAENFNVEPTVLLVGGDIKSAEIFEDPFGDFGVRIHFTPDGAKRWEKVIKDKSIKRFGWILDGDLIDLTSFSEGRDELPADEVHITGSLKKEVAERLVAAINDSKKK